MKTLRERWLEALRSGNYKQGRGVLRNKEDEFCCLGVLCDVAEPDKWKLTQMGSWRCSEFCKFFPGEYLIDDAEMEVEFSRDLAKLNDSGLYNFNDIADHIEGKKVLTVSI